MKKKLLASGVITICLAIIASGTLAFFTDDDTAHNVITSGNVDIDLVEELAPGVPYPDTPISGIMPGAAQTKIVRVDNVGTGAAWVRVKVETVITGADGKTLPNRLTADQHAVHLNIDTKNWTHEGGWYYYNTAVGAGDETANLFDTVTFSPAMDNAYQGCTTNINIYAEAVQTANNGAKPTEAAGWAAADSANS